MRSRRTTLIAGIGVIGLGVGALQGQASAHTAAHSSAALNVRSTANTLSPLSRTQATRLGAHADRSVIVVFKNQVPTLPASSSLVAARRAAVAAIQRPVSNELAQLGARHVRHYGLVNAVSATVSAAEERRLAADGAVAEVVPNVTTTLKFPTTRTSTKVARPATKAQVRQAAASAGSEPECQPGKDGVELDPEALSAIHANANLPGSGPTAASLGITGAGVKVGFIAEGFKANQPNFIRANGSRVVTDSADFTGEGISGNVTGGTFTGGEASLDASSIAAQGRVVYQLPLSKTETCLFRVEGAAPGASVVALKGFADDFAATTTSLLDAINYGVMHDHVNVLSESFGYGPLPDTMNDVLRLADDAAVKAGVVVDASTGDAGPTGTQGSPSTDPAVISAGASTTYRTYAQADIEGYHELGATGWLNDNLSGLSSGGVNEGGTGPDLLAPGDLNWVTCNPGPGEFGACISGGTSEAAPLTGATAALVIQAYRSTHGGASPTPAQVHAILTSTATDLGLPSDQQGAGLINSYRAVLAAEGSGSTLLTDPGVISATAPTGTTVSHTVDVTNSGTSAQTVSLHGRVLSAPTTVADDSFTQTGSSWEKVLHFTVKPGASYLSGIVSGEPRTPNGFIDLTLLDPHGNFAFDGLPQGATATSLGGVRDPAPGQWTAVVTYGGGVSTTNQPVQFVASTQTWKTFGSVTPSQVTLSPGATKSVTVSMSTPATAGDESAAVELDSGGQRTSIPVTLRSLVPLTSNGGTFSESLTGGNGRGGALASTTYASFDVPAGEPALNVSTAFKNGNDNTYSTYLISPSGEALGHASNQLVEGGTGPDAVVKKVGGTATHVLSPAAGQWTLIVGLANPASGPKVTSPLTGTITFAASRATASGLPTSTSSVVPVGSSKQVSVTIKNTTGVQQSYFLDARTNKTVSQTLTPLSPPEVSLPLSFDVPTPQWIVPSDTTSLVGRLTASAPATFDMSPYLGNSGGELNGDPQIGATVTGDTAVARWSDDPVTSGVWNLDPGLTGTYKGAGAATQHGRLSLTATTLGFNSAITSTTGDFYVGTSLLQPVTVLPGQSVTIKATIAPTSVGTTTGTLFVDSFSSLNPYGPPVPAADQVAAIPYSYTAR